MLRDILEYYRLASSKDIKGIDESNNPVLAAYSVNPVYKYISSRRDEEGYRSCPCIYGRSAGSEIADRSRKIIHIQPKEGKMDRFKLIFEKKGEVQKYDNYISNEVWLDVGNKLEMVFFDHHQEKELKGWIFYERNRFPKH